jgi:hypothetical protein
MVNWKLASPLCVADTSLRRASNGSPHPHFPCCSFHWIFPFKKKITGYSDQQGNGSKLLSTESLLRYTIYPFSVLYPAEMLPKFYCDLYFSEFSLVG